MTKDHTLNALPGSISINPGLFDRAEEAQANRQQMELNLEQQMKQHLRGDETLDQFEKRQLEDMGQQQKAAASESGEGDTPYHLMRIQPGHFNEANRLGYLDGAVIKRICSANFFWLTARAQTSDEKREHFTELAREELRKARHEIDLILEWRFTDENL